jgi:hypothetical protein
MHFNHDDVRYSSEADSMKLPDLGLSAQQNCELYKLSLIGNLSQVFCYSNEKWSSKWSDEATITTAVSLFCKILVL